MGRGDHVGLNNRKLVRPKQPRPPKMEAYYFNDGPCDFHSKEQQRVDELMVARGVPITWLDARAYDTGPYIVRFSITALPTLVLYRAVPNQISTTVLLEGADLRNSRTLTKWLDKLTMT